jgi:acyl-CoA hydrolase
MTEQSERDIRPAEPLTSSELVFPSDLNTHGTMFGGNLVAMMDKCAGLCVGRWCNRTTVTASIDAIQFCVPVRQGQMVEALARIVYVGRTSCMVKVMVHAHDLLSGDRFFCCEGYFTMVGVDTHGRPVVLPMIPVETEEERLAWETAAQIKEAMLQRRMQLRNKL